MVSHKLRTPLAKLVAGLGLAVSLLLAVMASGLNGQSFAFNGYLPTDAAQRASRIKELEAQRGVLEKQREVLARIQASLDGEESMEPAAATAAGPSP